MYTIARHELYQHLRKAKRLSYKTDFNITSIAEIATTAASKIEKQRSAQMLHRLLSHLPTNQQLLIELYYWHDFDAGSLAEIFEVSRETIRSRIFRIRQLLRSQLSNARPTSPTMRPAQES